MEGMSDFGRVIADVLSKLFKNRPNCAYAIFTFLILAVLGAMLFKAQNPNDYVFPILGLAFILIVVLSRAIQGFRQHSVQEYQVIDQAPIDQEKPLDQETKMPDLEEKLYETPQRKQQTTQYPKLTAKDRRKVMIISAVFFALGYIMLQLFFVYMPFVQDKAQMINWIGGEEFYNLTIKDTFFQVICGLPCALSIIIPILIVLSAKFYQLAKSNLKILSITYAILGFIFGIIFYIPIQIFMALMLIIGGYETHT